MKKFDWGNALGLLANVGVILGIGIAVLEIRVNTRAIEAQTRDSITQREMEIYGWLANNRDLTRVVVSMMSGTTVGESASTVDRRMWTGFAQALLREHENVVYQHERGLLLIPHWHSRVTCRLPGSGNGKAA